jgi:hypothetical protein
VKLQIDYPIPEIPDGYVLCKGTVAFKCNMLYEKGQDCIICKEIWANVLRALIDPINYPFLQKMIGQLNWQFYLSF